MGVLRLKFPHCNAKRRGGLVQAARASQVSGFTRRACYQTRQPASRTMGWPWVQPNALWNASRFLRVPVARQ